MTTAVSLLGMFATPQGARDTKTNDDNTLASFAGLLAGANQAAAKLIVPAPQADGLPDGDVLENAEDSATASDAKSTGDSKEASAIVATPSVDAGSTTVVSVTNPNAVNSSIAALNPALQEKLARVVSRMRDETGHDVQVAETYRSQTRQNTLYAQGRSADGPVVTWTQHSKHTQGRAVDVILDGGRANADAYANLQRIANEEGLRTLGAKDPGHLELPSKNATTSQASNDVISIPRKPESGPGQSSVARLAQVASVAEVATVANVAGGSRTGGARANAEITIPDATGSSGDENSLTPATVDVAAQNSQSSAQPATKTVEISNLDRLTDAVNATRVEVSSQTKPNEAKVSHGSTQLPAPSIGRSPTNRQSFSGNGGSTGRDSSGYSAIMLRPEIAPQFSLSDVSTEMPSTASQRAERIMAAQDAPARPLSQIVMSVDNGNGTSDRIQVGLRGSTVNATIDAADHHAADAMRTHSDELVRSLTRDGVDVESVRVRETATTTAAAQVTTVDSSRRSPDTSSNSRFNRDAQWDQQRSQQRSNSERRQQQRNQRGGKES